MTAAEQKLVDALAVLHALDSSMVTTKEAAELIEARKVAFERAQLAAREYAQDPGKS